MSKSLKLQVSIDTIAPAAGFVKLVVKDTNSVYLIFSSGYKVNVKVSGGGGSAVITSIVAGNGLSGGGTSGVVTLTVDSTKFASAYALSLKSAKTDTAGGDLSGTLSNLQYRTGSITSVDILNGTILSGDLSSSSVTSVKIADGTIIAQDIATGAVTSTGILDHTIDSIDIAYGSITTELLKDLAISGEKIAPNSIDASATVIDGSVGYSSLSVDAVHSDIILDSSIVGADIQANTVVRSINGAQDALVFTASGGALLTLKLHTFPTVDTIDFNAGAGSGGGGITAINSGNARLIVVNPTGATTTLTIPDNGIDSNAIAASNVTNTDIKDGTIISADLATASVTTTAIADATIVAADLSSDAVTTAKILDGTLLTADQASTFKAKDSDSTDYARRLAIKFETQMRGDTFTVADARITTAMRFSADFFTSKPVNGNPVIDSVRAGFLRGHSTYANEPDSVLTVIAVTWK